MNTYWLMKMITDMKKITASPPVANVMDLITGRQFELFQDLLQKEDFFFFSPMWKPSGSKKANSYRGNPVQTPQLPQRLLAVRNFPLHHSLMH